ncbi:glycosyltransferase family 1 protein [Oleiagrimonas sp. C23AA]|uniref:glycosyltransferase family 4 protein n=1 Tax=Oleiagrimonas sp. C23AA TaxID=2719047 RepID=UPI00141F828D|nr:glycosyltransferase family 1 protein [Oleiagrimonas sp. C23AA]NII10183.1 glycosyltransferase family 1 protein [Oleiagrimonas sp. C23AA]
MRIGIVTETYPPEVNGVALTVHSLAEGLAARGHLIDLIRPRQSGEAARDDADELRVPGMGIPRYPGLRFGLPAARRLRQRWRQQRPDVLYIATEGPLGGSALRAAQRLKLPAASGFHTRFDHYARHYGLGWLTPLVQARLRRFHRQARATLVPTQALAAELEALGIERVKLLHRAVDTELFHPGRRDSDLRRTWGVDETTPVVLYVGRIAPEKHLDLAVKAFRAMQKARPEARFVWVGDGPSRAELEAAHADFIFTGIQRGEALARHYASADLFVFPSRSETFGNVVLEALASALPCVAFDDGAAREHLRDAINGRRVPDGDDAAFIAAATDLVQTLDAPLRQRARDSVAHLHPERVIDDFEHLLMDMAAPAPVQRTTSLAAKADSGVAS